MPGFARTICEMIGRSDDRTVRLLAELGAPAVIAPAVCVPAIGPPGRCTETRFGCSIRGTGTRGVRACAVQFPQSCLALRRVQAPPIDLVAAVHAQLYVVDAAQGPPPSGPAPRHFPGASVPDEVNGGLNHPRVVGEIAVQFVDEVSLEFGQQCRDERYRTVAVHPQGVFESGSGAPHADHSLLIDADYLDHA